MEETINSASTAENQAEPVTNENSEELQAAESDQNEKDDEIKRLNAKIRKMKKEKEIEDAKHSCLNAVREEYGVDLPESLLNAFNFSFESYLKDVDEDNPKTETVEKVFLSYLGDLLDELLQFTAKCQATSEYSEMLTLIDHGNETYTGELKSLQNRQKRTPDMADDVWTQPKVHKPKVFPYWPFNKAVID